MSVRGGSARAASVVAAVVSMSALGTAPALAGVVGGGGRPSPRVFVESGLPVTFPAGAACGFDVTLAEVANRAFSRAFPNGNERITGRLAVRVTNDETGASVVRNISGPVLVTTGPGGESVVILSGVSLTPVFDGNDATGQLGTGLFVTHGPVVFTDLKLTRVSGSVENLCRTLA